MLIEPAEPTDRAFIARTWAEALRKSPLYSWAPSSVYFQRIARRIDRLLDKSTVLVVRPSIDPGILMLDDGDEKLVSAWICAEPGSPGPLVHFLFVKQGYRRMGLARTLLRKLGWAPGRPIVCTAWTPVCESVGRYRLLFMPSFLEDKHSTATAA